MLLLALTVVTSPYGQTDLDSCIDEDVARNILAFLNIKWKFEENDQQIIRKSAG